MSSRAACGGMNQRMIGPGEVGCSLCVRVAAQRRRHQHLTPFLVPDLVAELGVCHRRKQDYSITWNCSNGQFALLARITGHFRFGHRALGLISGDSYLHRARQLSITMVRFSKFLGLPDILCRRRSFSAVSSCMYFIAERQKRSTISCACNEI